MNGKIYEFCGTAGRGIGQKFSGRLKEYKISKGTIQLPYSRPVPVELISDIAGWCYETGNHP